MPDRTTPDSSIRVSLLTSHRLYGDCMATALSSHDSLGSIAVWTLEDLQPAPSFQREEILIVDIQREADRLLSGLERLSLEPNALRIVLIGATDAIDPLVRGAALRPAAIVAGEVSVETLVDIVHQVRRGELYCCARLGFRLSRHLAKLALLRRREEIGDAHLLSFRELEVLQLIADGLDNRTIADRLCLSICTVKNHVHSILEKLDACSRTEAAAKAYRCRWFTERRQAAR